MCCRFDPLSKAVSNRCVFDENTQCINVDGRPTRIEMYAFSKENALVWTTGANPGFFLGGGALVSWSTSTPINHIVFFFFGGGGAEYQLC